MRKAKIHRDGRKSRQMSTIVGILRYFSVTMEPVDKIIPVGL